MPFYPTVDMTCDIVDWQERMHYIDDALGMCTGLSSFHLKPSYHIHNIPQFMSSGSGIDMDEAQLSQAAKRYRTLVRIKIEGYADIEYRRLKTVSPILVTTYEQR